MRVPLSWLRAYVQVDGTPRELADKLTFAGIEVEAIDTIGAAYENFVVGEVRAVTKHPNADKLSVCQVFDGQQEVQVVCGAPNVKAGGKYPFAKVGATLPDGSLTIKKAKLRGVESHGMLCAEDELGLSKNHDGLMTLDPKWTAGTLLAEVLGPPETVFEIEITPNRPDCISLIGVARELGALCRKPLHVPTLKPQSEAQGALDVRVEVQDPTGCPRYTARLLRNVKIGPSPDLIKRRLEHAGIRSINNVVDITNYVMLETGQPLHAFDHAQLAGGAIIVRRAKPGETMKTLDGVERKLNADMLVIADASKPVALAGIMGGAGSEISDTTTTVLLESAHFQPTTVRATARQLGLFTDSSYRFERGVDVDSVERASRRAAELMIEFAGATLEPGLIDLYPAPLQSLRVTLRPARVCAVLGVDASADEIREALASLGMTVTKDGDALQVEVPPHRGDLLAEIDLIEEFSRIHGLDRIPTRPSRAIPEQQADDRATRATSTLRSQLAGLGLREVVNYSLVANPLLDLFDTSDAGLRVVLPRPVTADQSILRTSLVPQMVETLGRNRAHQTQEASLFEIGRVFAQDAAGKPAESTQVCIGLMGPVGRPELQKREAVKAEEMFLWAKGVATEVFARSKLGDPQLKATALPWAESGLAFELLANGRVIGRIGVVKSAIRREWRLHEPVAVMDLDAAPLLAPATRAGACKPLPTHPSTERDVALICEESLQNGAIEQVMRRAAPRELEQIRLFDIFRGTAIGAGRKSLAYALTYRAADRTLTDDEANGYHDKVKAALRQELKVDIRES